MTFGVMVAIVLGKRIGLKQRLIIQQTTHSTSAQGLVKLSMYMVFIAFAFEALATIVLMLRWQQDFGWGQAAYYALFHSVSAFNNPEFALEATSAFSTTGLSMGLTSELSPVGKVIVAITMFAGRLGPLTLAYALAQKKRTSKIGYAEDHILIG